MTREEEHRLAEVIREVQVDLVDRISSLQGMLQGYGQLKQDHKVLRSDHDELRGAVKMAGTIFAVLHAIVAILVMLWIGGKLG